MFIVLTCNIVTGIMIGFATLVIGRLVSGEWRKLNLGTVIIAVALVGVLRRRLGDLNPSCSSRAAQAARFIF
ncbi:hypothetical protein LNQ03_15340 [Klebsiella pneumoniae subsp. pneumoniae]|nr:hypothetical protein [Klebsiella pneumoniae subsp. pneumoniae]